VLTLTGTAVEVWDRLAPGCDLDELARHLADRFGTEVETVTADLTRLVERLETAGAITVAAIS
jgi:hypothetical protein